MKKVDYVNDLLFLNKREEYKDILENGVENLSEFEGFNIIRYVLSFGLGIISSLIFSNSLNTFIISTIGFTIVFNLIILYFFNKTILKKKIEIEGYLKKMDDTVKEFFPESTHSYTLDFYRARKYVKELTYQVFYKEVDGIYYSEMSKEDFKKALEIHLEEKRNLDKERTEQQKNCINKMLKKELAI